MATNEELLTKHLPLLSNVISLLDSLFAIIVRGGSTDLDLSRSSFENPDASYFFYQLALIIKNLSNLFSKTFHILYEIFCYCNQIIEKKDSKGMLTLF